MRIGGTLVLVLVVSGLPATAVFGQSVVLSDGGVSLSGSSVQSTAVFTGTAPLAKTGQTSCFDASGNLTACGSGVGAGQEGHLQKGVRWPIPRFTNNGDGTVTDNMTGLIWLEDANCAGETKNFDDALTFANTLYDGSSSHGGGDCGLSDGSVEGDWRVPNMFEAASLMDHGYSSPGVPNTTGTGQWTEGDPFSDIQGSYWTSTFNPQNKQFAHYAAYGAPQLTSNWKTTLYSVWPVRGPVDAGSSGQADLVLADGGIQFPDGSVQSTAALTRVVVPKTGQQSCYNGSGVSISCTGTGQDGDHQAGAAWPNPRFTNNSDGTVTDNLTGLVWLEDADCNGTKTWANALAWANGLYDGSIASGGVNQDCGLSDGSLPGEWRVPTEAEFESLACPEYDNPAVSNSAGTGQWVSGDPFLDLGTGNVYYWSSTSVASAPAAAVLVFPRSHATTNVAKSSATPYLVWPVRDSR
jgi:hypothetical protein